MIDLSILIIRSQSYCIYVLHTSNHLSKNTSLFVPSINIAAAKFQKLLNFQKKLVFFYSPPYKNQSFKINTKFDLLTHTLSEQLRLIQMFFFLTCNRADIPESAHGMLDFLQGC